jgi:hypothetical protein
MSFRVGVNSREKHKEAQKETTISHTFASPGIFVFFVFFVANIPSLRAA